MAVVLGTSSGFVLTAPTSDPVGGTTTVSDGASMVTKHTSPSNCNQITEVGWYKDSGTTSSNFQIGLYADSAGAAGTRLNVTADTASGTTAGWKTVSVNWTISPDTAYWLGVQQDAHSGSSYIDGETSGGSGIDRLTSQTALPDPFGGGAVADADGMYAIYAKIGNRVCLPSVGALALTGFAPTADLSDNKNIAIGLGELALTGFAPTVSIDVAANPINVTPSLGELALTGFAPKAYPSTKVEMFDDFADGNFTSGYKTWTELVTGKFTVNNTIANSLGHTTNEYALVSTALGTISAPSTQGYGIWEFDVYFDNLGSGDRWIKFIAADTALTGDGYTFLIAWDGNCSLRRYYSGGSFATLFAKNVHFATDTWYRIRVTRNTTTDQYHIGAADTFAVSTSTDGLVFTLIGGLSSGANPTSAQTSYATSTLFAYGDEQAGDRLTNINIGTSFSPSPKEVTPSLGELALTGYAPTAVATSLVNATPSTGELVLAGYLPTVFATDTKNITIGLGEVALTGYAPSVAVSDNKNIVADVGALVLAGFNPTVTATANQFINPSLGELVLTNYAPTVSLSDNKNITLSTGVLALEGFAPTVSTTANINITPDVGSVLLSGLEPLITVGDAVNIQIGLGELSIEGFAPTIAVSDNKSVTPELGELSISGIAPEIFISQSAITDTGEVLLTGFAPVVTQTDNKNILPSAGELVINGFAPTVTVPTDVEVFPSAGELVVTGYAPDVYKTAMMYYWDGASWVYIGHIKVLS